ncbi:MAG: phosphoribosylformylglycinamidine synthase subunit PurL [Thermaerobacter sp.]|nr:phosphoribosylformylglycinamidine synthase subunit PurL [Thermaerobacter sp.]
MPLNTVDPTTLGLRPSECEFARRQAGRELSDLEWAVLSVLWSEHCAYKHSRALLSRLPREGERVLAGPGAGAGVLDIGEGWAVAAKVESHNHPSAVEPLQGAATGIGGIMRDVLSMGARPAAFLDSLRFGMPGTGRTDYLLRGVVAGIAHYGNCVGVPTVGGDLYFHPSYERNPLVNAMCVGFLRHEQLRDSAASGEGNRFLLLGARTGRDGIGGAAFASVTLREDAAEDRPRVQVGDPFLGKLLIEATLEILACEPVVAIQDLGAGGLAGALIEMCAKGGVGAEVWLERVPLRAADLAPAEILLSESQERMLLLLPPASIPAAQATAQRLGIIAAEVGEVRADGEIAVTMGGELLSRLSAAIYAEAPMAPLAPASGNADAPVPAEPQGGDARSALLALLARPNLSSRAGIYGTYDQDVGLRTVVRPGLDAAVLRAAPGAPGVAVAVDQTPRYCERSARIGASLAVCEAARNVAARGAVPIGLTNCLNLGSPERPEAARELVDVVDGIAEAANELGIPVTGGNVSLYNESGGLAIVPTPVIGMIGHLPDPERAIGVGSPIPGMRVLLLGQPADRLAGSEFAELAGVQPAAPAPPDYPALRAVLNLLPAAGAAGEIALAHDVADGGLLVALAEIVLHTGLGVSVNLAEATPRYLFGEPSALFIAVTGDPGAVLLRAAALGVRVKEIGEVTQSAQLVVGMPTEPLWSLERAQLQRAVGRDLL